MTNVNQIHEPFLTHHSVDDAPLVSFDEAIAIFQKHFPVTDPSLHDKSLVYRKFSGIGFANAYQKVARSIINQHNLPLVATAWQRYKSGIATDTYLTISFKS